VLSPKDCLVESHLGHMFRIQADTNRESARFVFEDRQSYDFYSLQASE